MAALLEGKAPTASYIYDTTYVNIMRSQGQEALLHEAVSTRRRRLQASPASCLLEDLSDEVITGYMGAYGITSCASVAAAGQCGTTNGLAMCPVSCGVCDGTADLSGFCDCFTTAWSMASMTPQHCWAAASTLLPIAKDSCGAGWYFDVMSLPGNVVEWEAGGVLSWALMGGNALGVDGTKFFLNFLNNQPITGSHFAQLSRPEMQAMGFNVGEADLVHSQVNNYFFGQYISPPLDTYATWEPPEPPWETNMYGDMQRTLVRQNPIEIGTTVVLEALIGIDEVNFCFEVQFLLVLAWQDERVNTKCTGAGRNGQPIPSSDRCAHYWQPDMPPVFANQVSIDGNPPVEILEDLGLFTFPGKHRPDCMGINVLPEELEEGARCGSPISTSMAYRMMRLRGSFGASMEFRRSAGLNGLYLWHHRPVCPPGASKSSGRSYAA